MGQGETEGKGVLFSGSARRQAGGATAACRHSQGPHPPPRCPPLPAHLQGTGGGRDHAQAHIAARYDRQGAPYFGGVHGGYGRRRESQAGTAVAGGEAIAVEAPVRKKLECVSQSLWKLACEEQASECVIRMPKG